MEEINIRRLQLLNLYLSLPQKQRGQPRQRLIIIELKHILLLILFIKLVHLVLLLNLILQMQRSNLFKFNI